jgi:hypothetical protein
MRFLRIAEFAGSGLHGSTLMSPAIFCISAKRGFQNGSSAPLEEAIEIHLAGLYAT